LLIWRVSLFSWATGKRRRSRERAIRRAPEPRIGAPGPVLFLLARAYPALRRRFLFTGLTDTTRRLIADTCGWLAEVRAEYDPMVKRFPSCGSRCTLTLEMARFEKT